jgi:hypothetical protein
MKKSQFTEQQIAFALQQADQRTPVAAGVRKLARHCLRQFEAEDDNFDGNCNEILIK